MKVYNVSGEWLETPTVNQAVTVDQVVAGGKLNVTISPDSDGGDLVKYMSSTPGQGEHNWIRLAIIFDVDDVTGLTQIKWGNDKGSISPLTAADELEAELKKDSAVGNGKVVMVFNLKADEMGTDGVSRWMQIGDGKAFEINFKGSNNLVCGSTVLEVYSNTNVTTD